MFKLDFHYSCDETAVLVGVERYALYYDKQSGRIKVDINGNNTWDNDDIGIAYFIEKLSTVKVETYLNELIMR